MKKKLYRTDQVAEMLGMSRRTVYRLLESGELESHNDSPGRRGLRVTVDSVENYLSKFRNKSDTREAFL